MTEEAEAAGRVSLWVAEGDSVLLRGVHCRRCESLLFPPQQYGCEACGAEGQQLTEALIPAAGVLHSFTTVYVHPTVEVPFQVAEVLTEARQPIRARLEHPEPELGGRVEGHVQLIGDRSEVVFGPIRERG